MNPNTLSIAISFLLLISTATFGQPKKTASGTQTGIIPDSAAQSLFKPQKSVTRGRVTVWGTPIDYQAVAGTLILKNKKDKPTCSMFYTAYFKSDVNDLSLRPVTFIYNGGPGSSTVWLHFSGLGPRRVFLKDTERFLPPYKIVNNEYSLLDATDLVFIDMPETGFSRILTKENGGAGDAENFFSVDGDGHAFADFIREFLSAYNRWNSPKYLYGESYGTFRSAVVSNILETEDNIDLNGVILQSMLFSFNKSQMSQAHAGDILSYVLALPSEAAAAWVHNKIPDRPAAMVPFLDEVKHFAITDYSLALLKGALLDSNTFNRIASKLHDYTGLPASYIRKANLRIGLIRFEKQLLADQEMATGAYDATFTGPEIDPLSEYPFSEPTTSTVSSALISTFNTYMSNDLKFGKGMEYRFSNNAIFPRFDFRASYNGPNWQDKFFVNVMGDMASAMVYNPKLKVMVNMGYYDLVTPYFEGEYEMQHLNIPASLQKNISYAYYNSGHMIYLKIPELKKLHDNVVKFINSTY